MMIKITDLQKEAKKLRRESGISLEKLSIKIGEFDSKMSTSASSLNKLIYKSELPDTQNNREQLQNVIAFFKTLNSTSDRKEAELLLYDVYLIEAIQINFERLNIDWGIQGEVDELEFNSNTEDYTLSSIFRGRYADRDSIIFQMIGESGELNNCALIYGILKEGEEFKSFTLLVTEGILSDTAEFNVYSDSYKQISYINGLFNENPIIQNEHELSEEECEKLYKPIISDIKNQKIHE